MIWATSSSMMPSKPASVLLALPTLSTISLACCVACVAISLLDHANTVHCILQPQEWYIFIAFFYLRIPLCSGPFNWHYSGCAFSVLVMMLSSSVLFLWHNQLLTSHGFCSSVVMKSISKGNFHIFLYAARLLVVLVEVMFHTTTTPCSMYRGTALYS